jgi:hypothetical protein
MPCFGLSMWLFSGNFVEVFARQMGMLSGDGPIDQSDLYFRAPCGAFHKRPEFD